MPIGPCLFPAGIAPVPERGRRPSFSRFYIMSTIHRHIRKASLLATIVAASVLPLRASVPDAVPYQGRVAVDGVNYSGTGQFKFAIYEQAPGDAASVVLLWTNADGAAGGATVSEPAVAVSLPVANGLYVAGLGDTATTNMAALPATLAPASGKRTFVRVWFNDGKRGFQPLLPDLELRSVPFAREAGAIGGTALSNLARLDSLNVFNNTAGLTVTGNGPSSDAIAMDASVPVSGPGSRMEFLPGYGAFRAGSVDGSQWDIGSVGAHSVALGRCTTASGYGTTATGVWTSARGTFATAMGLSTAAESYGEMVVGCYDTNYTPSNAYGWDAADRLFVVGNGMNDSERSDAMTVYKNAVVVVRGNGPNSSGTVRAADATVPVSGAGTRMMFLPGYGAFRAGKVDGDHWDAANIGIESVALGRNVTASGSGSVALGTYNTASGSGSFVAGFSSDATGSNSISMGTASTASGLGSVSIGMFMSASGESAFAYGNHGSASGARSLALGDSANATGTGSTAISGGTATGNCSFSAGAMTEARSFAEVVLGYANSNNGYSPVSATEWVATDRLLVVGGMGSNPLVLLKNGNLAITGALTQGSDRNRKTDIVPIDPAAVLDKVTALPLATWRYKDDTVTHLGPMAQDFFAAFHLGADETGIASVDADGVALAAIQALKKQLDAKDARIAQLEQEHAALAARLAALEAKLK